MFWEAARSATPQSKARAAEDRLGTQDYELRTSVEHSGLSTLGFFFRVSPRAVERGEGGAGIVAIGWIQRIIWMVLVGEIEGIVGSIAIRWIDGVAVIKAVGGVEGIFRRIGLRRIQRIVRRIPAGRIEDVVVALVLLREVLLGTGGSTTRSKST